MIVVVFVCSCVCLLLFVVFFCCFLTFHVVPCCLLLIAAACCCSLLFAAFCLQLTIVGANVRRCCCCRRVLSRAKRTEWVGDVVAVGHQHQLARDVRCPRPPSDHRLRGGEGRRSCEAAAVSDEQRCATRQGCLSSPGMPRRPPWQWVPTTSCRFRLRCATAAIQCTAVDCVVRGCECKWRRFPPPRRR